MSKSDENVNAWVAVLDKPEDIMRKFKRAVTDSEAVVKYGENKAGVNNLMGIYSAVTGKTNDEIEKEFEGKGYGDFKATVAEAVIEELRPIRERYENVFSYTRQSNEESWLYQKAEILIFGIRRLVL